MRAISPFVSLLYATALAQFSSAFTLMIQSPHTPTCPSGYNKIQGDILTSSSLYAHDGVEIEASDCRSSVDVDVETQTIAFLENAPVTGPDQVIIYDTTLRDGTQGESISVSCGDKLKIAARLGEFGVDYIECGWPGSNPKDLEFFQKAQVELSPQVRKKLVAFGSTRRKNTKVEEDAQIRALVESGTDTVCMVAKGHKWQVTEILRASPENNLEMIRDSVAYLVKQGRRVFVDLEHFYDGYKHDAEYAMECCAVAVDAGANALVLCDTNGGSMPWEVEEITKIVVDRFGVNMAGVNGVTVGVHVHNDCGMAVANSVSGCKAGAGMVQGTMNGIGERTGNANLCAVIPTLALHVNSQLSCSRDDNLGGLTKLSRFIDEVMNLVPDTAAPFVGASAFAHKGGLHVAAMERSPDSYQHIDPSIVGNEKRVLVSELSGRQNIMGKIKEAGALFGAEDEEVLTWNERATAILNRVKVLENIGYTFEGADASVHLMILHANEGYCPLFKVVDYSVMVFDQDLDSVSRILAKDKGQLSKPTARATIKVRALNLIDEEAGNFTDHLEVSDGDGPVDALASALRRALVPTHPGLQYIELTDYKVRILDPERATSAATRVMIDFRDVERDLTWTTVSVDRNVISASLNALIDGFEYALIQGENEKCLLWEDMIK
mmetsp:Transcript_33349/g.48249  ORF Transcript_33349/g.48249 Transcript_33349/m.48249 type:complete len:665 (-) Transcript_33349:219-2213(-)|eukprot:CAMPEP_0116015124 /NCGR_PEP_ID=MMETSP0321-20121206/6656_1 /TAXON_ID=163516 /ORGANISM="Leptocylindrus danicus var. danicus, Strain B650" /LENGTH=664 /DNA_ID=CAMNT_0003484847 /DNA_START=64 /DNA_END=2058 /DNA_ORIENTATION=+